MRIAVMLLLMTGAALAQESTQVKVETINDVLQPILLATASAAATVLAALGVLLVTWVKKKLNLSDAEAKVVGLELDAGHRDALQQALINAAGLALNKLGNELRGKTIDVRDPAVASAVNSVLASAPDAIKYFGLDKAPDQLAQKIVAKLPQVANTTAAV